MKLHELSQARELLLQMAQRRRRAVARTPQQLAEEPAGAWLAQESLEAPRDWPPHDLSRMDGYALAAEGLRARGLDVPLPLLGHSYAETAPDAQLPPDSAWRVQTGAPLPRGADTVVPQEECQPAQDGAAILVRKMPHPGAWVRPAGAEARRGQVLARAPLRLGPALLGLLCGLRMEPVQVWRRPRVAVLSLGNELPARGDANGPLLAAALRRMGLQAGAPLPVADDLGQLCDALVQVAAEHDLILSSGGASVGDRDHLRPALERVGSLDMMRLNLKPGMPLAIGRVGGDGAESGDGGDGGKGGGTALIGLPGNPLTVAVLWGMLVAPALRHWMGDPQVLPPQRTLALAKEVHNDGRRPWIMLGRLQDDGAALVPAQHSGMLPLLGQCDCAVRVEPGERLAAGAEAPGWTLNDWGLG